MKNRGPILFVAVLALALAWTLAPHPSADRGREGMTHALRPMVAGISMSESPASIRPLVISHRRFGGVALRSPVQPDLDPSDALADDEPVATGFLTGHVVDEHGFPVTQAVVHLHGPEGTLAHRVREDGTFHIAVPEGRWTAEAGWFDGSEEWRSHPMSAEVTAGESVPLPLEILMGGAGHGVHASISEQLGLGWEVEQDDGPLKAGDLLVEVDGRLLADLMPASVRAALRSRPGESIPAVVLRRQPSGDYEEVPVVLDAR